MGKKAAWKTGTKLADAIGAGGGGGGGLTEPVTINLSPSSSGVVGNAHFKYFNPAGITTLDGVQTMVNSAGSEFLGFTVVNNSSEHSVSVFIEVELINLDGSGDFLQAYSTEQPLTIAPGDLHTFETFTQRAVAGTSLEIDGGTSKIHGTGAGSYLIGWNIRLDPA